MGGRQVEIDSKKILWSGVIGEASLTGSMDFHTLGEQAQASHDGPQLFIGQTIQGLGKLAGSSPWLIALKSIEARRHNRYTIRRSRDARIRDCFRFSDDR